MSSKKKVVQKVMVFRMRDDIGDSFALVLAVEGGNRAALGYDISEGGLDQSLVPPSTRDREDGIWVGHGTEWRLATRDELMALGHGKDPFKKKSGKKNVKK